MKELKYFIFGVIFYVAAIPIIESLTEIVSTGLEYFKGVVSKPVLEMNKTLLTLQTDLEKHDEAVCVGFDIKSSEDYEEIDDKKKSYKI